ncbi:MAG: methionine gamma-lyase family protein [Caldisericia bacterium]|nr:methionine gamma-lyase family protein [Caldisericia bacterium]
MGTNKFSSFEEINSCIEKRIYPALKEIQALHRKTFYKVLKAFQENNVSDFQFKPGFGYGLWDAGTQVTESVFASLFNAESAIVRPQITSGSQALFLILNSLLKSNDTLLTLTGPPYETLKSCIGIQDSYPGNLIEKGVDYQEIDLIKKEYLSFEDRNLVKKAKLCWIQKSRGYSERETISNKEIGRIIKLIRSENPSAIVAVDNCYGEFTEETEPIENGADVCAGSFMKNPGGGIARTGAYIVGKKILLERISSYLIAPGLGFEFMPNLGFTYEILLGLFHSPLTVKESLIGNVYFSAFLEEIGFSVNPKYSEEHYDIVLEIQCKTKENLELFSNAVQKCSPVDSNAKPDPFKQNGYKYPIIMAGGTFVPGSSIEFSADGFFHEPFKLYFQPGLYAEQTRILAEYIWNKLR